ncbi:TPA: LOW QUALITY PROTEIN: hypothetical protein N0F65_011206 [Lagenidium giganteum]|uniref:Isochorismatase hydrolase n=1 Tax=Lagenidium giganteum TaxID=4803 RepID=A0AAV2Z7Z3_9STRA|nr:TPA: LOW QUALITY PROTEIN: hypothetical protein N0F65_011206 [Lagenidium giganteum]
MSGRLDVHSAALLLVDHQTGLLSLNNVLALANAAELPTILATSFETGPNSSILPELLEIFPEVPLIARPGQTNAWDDAKFVQAVKATGKQQLTIAGVVTEVCAAFVTFPRSGLAVVHASGAFDDITRSSAVARMVAAGAQPMTWFGVACELHRDWRNHVEDLGAPLCKHIADYQNLVSRYSSFTVAHK